MVKGSIRWACAALVLGTASMAAAAEENPAKRAESNASASAFGQASQLVISQDFQFQAVYNTAGTDSLSIVLAPGADYFLRENLSVGAGIALGQLFQPGENATTVGVNVRLGYNIPYDANISFWPKLTVGFLYNKQDTFLFGPDGTFFQIGAFAPVLLHPASHFFVGLGPNVDILLGGGSGISFGVKSVIGGYF